MSWQGTRLTTRHLGGLPALDRPLVMGVVNVTPDSFSDGGRWFDPEAAIEHGLELLEDGADLLDIGGESTRPGATRPLVAEELDRVLPVITALAAEGATVSVDTMRGEVAEAALDAGAVVVNDVSRRPGRPADPRGGGRRRCVVRRDALARPRRHACSSTRRTTTWSATWSTELGQRVEAAVAAGIPADRVAVDPGLGFAKTARPQLGAAAPARRPRPARRSGAGRARAASRSSVRCSPTVDGAPRPVLDREAPTWR